MVPEERTRIIECKKCRMETTECVKQVPYTTCRMVTREHVKCVPHTTCKLESYCEVQKICRRVPVCVPICNDPCEMSAPPIGSAPLPAVIEQK
jgi:hypothetical protein